jgi:hypothetical protein
MPRVYWSPHVRRPSAVHATQDGFSSPWVERSAPLRPVRSQGLIIPIDPGRCGHDARRGLHLPRCRHPTGPGTCARCCGGCGPQTRGCSVCVEPRFCRGARVGPVTLGLSPCGSSKLVASAVGRIDRVSEGTMTSAAVPRHCPTHDSALAGEKRAVRFFWAVLMLATGASVAGNVTHAVLNATADAVVVAAAAALVPPTVLLGATHSVALLVRTRAGSGFTYWCALSMTLALAACAFVLSFEALRELAITVGIDTRLAWLWPLVIDLSIAQATMALLALTGRHRRSPQSSEPSRRALGTQPGISSSDGQTAAVEPIGRQRQRGSGSPNAQAPTKRAASRQRLKGPLLLSCSRTK